MSKYKEFSSDDTQTWPLTKRRSIWWFMFWLGSSAATVGILIALCALVEGGLR